MKGVVLDCFQELFSSSHPSTQDVEKVVWCIEKRLTDSMTFGIFGGELEMEFRYRPYPWIPRPHSFCPVTTPPNDVRDLKVVDFLVEGSRKWNVDKLALVVIRSVRGYRVVMESRMTASSTNLNPDSKWWCLLWRLQLPSKVELLIWRAFHDIIRTWTALRRRGVNCDAACPRRNNGMETTSHALLECPVSLEVCHLSRLWPTLADWIPLPFSLLVSSAASLDYNH
ncbi:hypothetical protein TIFTF001_012485 [Ficus carica]|uniref:Reverse transcriptase zinc-binding domain-containing protein n=1 Tax=Ficus carica TaxID=3494 RepID=A0AA88DI31_FICCA|nr:hypothetical protein TIFTF001_012485 [Ficus carica]